ncbi:Vacuolar morphogenesis protein 6 [Coemansia javaensis]|uniref:Vacuolar morphogenesis protein 6 n=1 Tax=Coemansia javaensis TaxID=2761396 RepID=A0A9W8H9M6_9FUNG|nr:Vacuolar morphogenesis protein 6 [Coemansia javaensis]
MHDAFAARAILRQLPVRIESAVAYGDRLLLGTATGALLVYQVADAARDRPPAVTLVETKRAFARRAVEQLGVIKEAGVLVCLADGLVTLYDLHTLSSATPLANTKGAHVMALHTGVDHTDGIPTLSSKLAVYAKRRVVVLEWRDSEFYKSFEHPAADRIVAMHFAAPGLLVLATAREFLTLQLPRGQWDDLFPADSASLRTVVGAMPPAAHGPDAAHSPPPAAAPASSAGSWGSWALGLAGSAPDAKTTIARMPAEKLLLCHKDIGVFVNSAAKLCRTDHAEPILFSRAPLGITYTSSYVVAISSSAAPNGSAAAATAAATAAAAAAAPFNVEIRNIGTQALVQTLCLAEEEPTHVFNASGGKQVWAIGPHTVWRLVPAPIQQQVEDVLGAAQYDEAISLVAQSDNILESEKEELTAKIRWLRARWLFRDQARYEDALAEFSDLGAPPTEVIALCPERIAGELAEPPSDAESAAGDQDPPSLETDPDAKDGPDTKDDAADTKEGAADTKEGAVGPGTPAPERRKQPAQQDADRAAWKDALYAVMRYLTEQRRWLQQALGDGRRELEYTVRLLDAESDTDNDRAAHQRGEEEEEDGDDDGSLPRVRLKRLAFSLERMAVPVAAMARVVDTTLLRVYLECSPGLLGPLLRVKNYCDVEQSEGLLLEYRRYTELVDLYHGKGLYRNALQQLQIQGRAVDTGPLRGTYATVRYLTRLPEDQFELVLEYVRWPLEAAAPRQRQQRQQPPSSARSESGSDSDEDWPAPETVVSMVFADDRPAAEAFPRVRVVQFLRQYSPELVIQYLAYVFGTWHDEAGVLHDEMVAAYLDLVGDAAPGARQKLQQFLRASRTYSPERLLARLPDDSLFEERALALGRLGRHGHALGLLVFSVGSISLAEQYCVENVAQCPGVFVRLLKILVAPPPPDVVDNEIGAIRADDGPGLADAAGLERARAKLHRQWVGNLLSAHPQRIPVAEALPLLPEDMAFSHDILTYLRSQLCALDQDLRTGNVVRNLGTAEDLQARRQLAQQQSRFVVVTETRTCPRCLKRIGSGTAFAVIPAEAKGAGPTVVHYSCFQRSRSAETPAPALEAGHGGGDDDDGSSSDTPTDSPTAGRWDMLTDTVTISAVALAVAGTAFAAAPAPAPTHFVRDLGSEHHPDGRTVTVTTTIHKSGAAANSVSLAAAALAGAIGFASYISVSLPFAARLARGLGPDLNKEAITIPRVTIALAIVAGCAAYALSAV